MGKSTMIVVLIFYYPSFVTLKKKKKLCGSHHAVASLKLKVQSVFCFFLNYVLFLQNAAWLNEAVTKSNN